MPTVTDGLIEITLTYDYNNTNAANVFYYWNQTNTSIVDMVPILDAFDATLFPEFSNICSDGVTFLAEEGRDVFGLLPNAGRAPSVLVGAITGQVTNNFTAARINLNVATKETRRGYKRIGGIAEDSVSGNDLTAAYRALVVTLKDRMLDSLAVGGETYVPVVYGQAIPTDPTRSIANLITNGSVSTPQVSQGSRKRQ